MRRHLPEGVFREQDSPSTPDVADETTPATPSAGPAGTLPKVSYGVAPRLVVASLIGALLFGFAGGRLMAGVPSGAPGTPSTTPSQPQTVTPPDPSSEPTQAPTLVPYEGPVRARSVVDAGGVCQEGASQDVPANLIDNNPATIWRCPGSGNGEQIRFRVRPADTFVGVRMINGNTVSPNGYLRERRILRVRWDFSNGSYFEQGLAANDPGRQQIRFPPVTDSQWVTLTVLDATSPGDDAPESNAVAISALEFLSPA